jgi:hypothetical protein
MLKRLFKLSEDHDGTLTATLDSYSETGVRTSHEDVDVSTLPGALCGDGGILGPVASASRLVEINIGTAPLQGYWTNPETGEILNGEVIQKEVPAEDSGASTLAEEAVEDESAADEPEESEEPEPLKGKLPADFPGHKDLDAAGVHTYGQLRKHVEAETLQEIPGIGRATAAKIVAALESDE